MRWVCLVALLLFVGCRQTKVEQVAVDRFELPQPERKRPRASRNPSGSSRIAIPKTPRIVPVNEITGRVAAVHPTLRFVVIDFYLSPLPQVDQRLGVFREGQKVGVVKISREERSQNVAADILAGEARVGDEVRVE